MPWPMVHFAIAAKLYRNDPPPMFLLGSIAPDAIHARDNATRKDKGFTHLVSEDIPPSIEKIKDYCLRYLDMKNDIEWKEYVLGYYAHIYTDLRWTQTLYADFERNYKGNKDIRMAYNEEVNQVDFELFRSEEWAQGAIANLKRAAALSMDPFVTDDEVDRYRDEKIEWLQNEGNEPRIKPVYFRVENVREFASRTADEIRELLL